MSSADTLDAIIADLRSIPDGDRRAIMRRLTVAERSRIERLLQPVEGGVRASNQAEYSDAVAGRIAAASTADDRASGMTAAGRDALLRAAKAIDGDRVMVAPSSPVREGGSLFDVIGRAFRRGVRR